MNTKIFAKKESILVCIAMIIIYFTEFTRLEFWIYEHLRLLQTCLAVSASLLIGVYLTRNVLTKAAKWSADSLEKLYARSKRITVSCLVRLSELSKLLVKKASILFKKLVLLVKKYSQELYLMARDIVDVRSTVPEKVTVAESLAATCQKIKNKTFVYKVAAAALSNVLILLFLVKGLKIESNSIIIPDYLEIQFLAYKAFILIRYKVFIAAQIIAQIIPRYFTLQNILLVVLTTSIAYILSLKRFREIIKNLLLEACETVTILAKKIGKSVGKKVSEESKILQSDVKDVANKQTWLQIKKEAIILKEELSTWEAKKKLLALAAASFVIIIMISGSLNHENNLWTSFVAATAGQSCDGTAPPYDERCDASETCCDAGACYTGGEDGGDAVCYNAALGTWDYDTNEVACQATWYCDGGSSGYACESTLYNTKSGNPWTWGQATTIGYEAGTISNCCGDDTGTPEYYLTCNKEAAITWSCLTSDKGCCKASTKCVDQFVAPATVPNCYTTEAGYKITSVSSGNDRFAYCSSNTWYECDTSEAYCELSGCAGDANFPLQGTDGGASSWVIGGESAAFGEYTAGNEIECCGDDTDENYRTRDCSSGCSSLATDNACCSATTDCVYANTCVTTAGCYTALGYACDTGSFYEADTTSGYCTSCNGLWYSSTSGGSNDPCCGDDGTNDDFHLIINRTDQVNDTCMFCDNGVNNSFDCSGHFGCHAAGELVYSSNTSVCDQGPDCYCISGQNCTSLGYEPSTLVEGPIPENCTTGGVYNNQYADCFTDGLGDQLNGSCRYSTGDPCTETGGLVYTFKNSTCADEGNTSVEGDAYGPYYCYCDEGCTTLGVNSTCTLGTRRPTCTSGTGVTDGGGNMACGEKDYDGTTTDACHYKTGDSCANPYNGGIEGCWQFQNGTTLVPGLTCTDCDSGYQADFTNNKCYYAVSCAANGWGGSNENCFEWCWGGTLDAASCFGGPTPLNRTEPANATTCYVSRTCTDSVNGCGWTTSTMRQDYCDQCGPTETYNATDYCPNINASCSSSCANDGTIWYGAAADNITRCSSTNLSCVIATDTLNYGDIWTGTAPASCDDTECDLDCTVTLGKDYGVCLGGVCTCNAIPNSPSITLNFTYADTNYTNETMWCEVYVNDADTETDMSVDIIIANNTADSNYVEQYTLSNAFSSVTEPAYVQFMINETNFTKGDYVICEARVYDQMNYSSWVNSSSLKVENYPVQISDPLGNFSIDEDFANFTLSWSNNLTDADNNAYDSGEDFTWTYFMSDTEILGMTMDNSTDTVTIGSLPNATGTVEVNWTVIDSSGAEYNETVNWTVNNINDPPNTVTDDYFLEPFNGNATLFNKTITFQWLNTTDPDPGDTLTYNLQVKQCGATDPSTCNPDTVDFSSFTQEGEISVTGLTEGTNITEYISMAEVTADQNYTWRLIAYDGTLYGGWSENWTFYLPSTVLLSLFDENMNFGSMNPGEVNDTTDNDPYPFRIRNDGNVLTDCNLTVDTAYDWLWDSYPTASQYFQYSIDNATAYSSYSEENGSFNWSDSATTPAWFDIPLTNYSANIRQLNYSDLTDEAEVDVRIEVPSNEGAGDKGSTVRITGWVSA